MDKVDELAERVARTMSKFDCSFSRNDKCDHCEQTENDYFNCVAKQILPLLEGRIQEAVRNEGIRIRKEQNTGMAHLGSVHREITQKLIQEAKKEERERIIKWGVEPCPHWGHYREVGVIKRDCSQCWQALEEGSKKG